MPHPTGTTNDSTARLIVELRKSKDGDYAALAKRLSRPARSRKAVNVGKLQKMKGDAFAVPGKVLSAGGISRPVDVYALSFSAAARSKIEKAGGKARTIDRMLKEKAKARIVS